MKFVRLKRMRTNSVLILELPFAMGGEELVHYCKGQFPDWEYIECYPTNPVRS